MRLDLTHRPWGWMAGCYDLRLASPSIRAGVNQTIMLSPCHGCCGIADWGEGAW